MNKQHHLYKTYQEMKWSLDDWAIPKECFDKIVEILPFESTILELGSGTGTQILSKFYNVISIETDTKWLNKYNSTYLHVPFDDNYRWYDVNILKQKMENLKQNYDLFLIDGPKGYRHKIINHLDVFNQNIPWIFDDTMAEDHMNTAKLCSEKLNKHLETFDCKPNPKAVYWKNGKKFTILK
jgi:hypothetical protein